MIPWWWLLALPFAFSLGVLVGAIIASKPSDAREIGYLGHVIEEAYLRGQNTGRRDGWDEGFRAGMDHEAARPVKVS